MTIKITGYIIEDNLQHGKIIAENVRAFSDKTANVVIRPQIIPNYISFYENLNEFTFSDNDLFIIDIHLNTYFSGVELAKKIRSLNENSSIIFLTSDETKGIQVINLQIDPIGYIVKQLSSNNLFKEELFSLLKEISTELILSLSNEKILTFRSGSNQILLNPNEIYYIATIKGSRGTVIIKTKNNELTCTEPLIKIKKKIENFPFFIAFKSYIINLNHVQSYARLDGVIVFDQKSELYVGTKIIDKISKKIKY